VGQVERSNECEPPMAFDALHLFLAVIAIVMEVVVSTFAHIEASIVPMPVSLTNPNCDAADPDIYVFRHDDWFVVTFDEAANAGIVRSGTRKRANTAFFMTFSSGWGRSPSQYLVECAPCIPEVCIE